ncbi:MAG: amidase [Gammaproteobacteria bacterium]|nr:amidase [Gammaproteobacteria bacterium]
MQLSEYCSYDGIGLAELVRNGEVTSAELVELAEKAIQATNPKLNSVMETIPNKLRGDYNASGTFAGVPFLIKDILLKMKGIRSENCSELCAGMVSEYDSHLMMRYREAGLVVVGRTATPEFGYDANTESRFHGSTKNPWDTSRIAGGSSGGSGASVAAGVVPMAHANDGGGSIRIPACHNGLVGMKPSRGRTPLGPDFGEYLNGLAIEHAVTRTVRDSAALLDCCEGPELGDPFQIPRPSKSYLTEVTTDPSKLKIAWTDTAWSNEKVDAEVKEATQDAATLLLSLGHTVENDSPQFDYSSYFDTTNKLWSATLAAGVEGSAALTGREVNLDTIETSVMACRDFGRTLSATDLLACITVCSQVTRAVAPFFADYDVLVTPTVGTTVPKLGFLEANRASGWEAMEWTQELFSYIPFTALFNMTGQPALSLPLGKDSQGLPIGIQFVAANGREDILYQLAGQLEQAAPWNDRRPAVYAG